MHLVLNMCHNTLHREYLPYLPVRCDGPQGPLDEPTFPPQRYPSPPGFWAESAKQVFYSCRTIKDLLKMCQERSALVETPLVGYSVYTAAFMGMYAQLFPHMDTENLLHSSQAGTASDASTGSLSEFRRVLKQMSSRLPMAVM